MPRRKRTRRKRTEEEPELSQRAQHFGEEVNAIGERLGKRMERRSRDWERHYHHVLGPIGPLVSSVIGLIIIAIVIAILGIAEVPLIGSGLAVMHSFLLDNIGLLFILMLFFSYATYFSRLYPKEYLLFHPIVRAVGLTTALWVLTYVLTAANVYLTKEVIDYIVSAISHNTEAFFALFLLIGYLILLVRMASCPHTSLEYRGSRREQKRERIEGRRGRSLAHQPMRLYRSGREKILGGVCGGIAEYLGVDPVVVRLIFIMLLFAWGFGLLLYIILWIIVPRNPKDRW